MLNGLAKDGGLFVPKNIKKLTHSQLVEISKLNYEKLAFEITKLFIGIDDIDQNDYKQICKKKHIVKTLVKKLFL